MANKLTIGSLFSGIGVMDFGLQLAGLEHKWFCEIDDARADILRLRWPALPVHPDICAMDEGVEKVDVIAGGFPPGGFSQLHSRYKDKLHPGIPLWREMVRVVGLLRPKWMLLETLPTIINHSGGEFFGSVLSDLAEIGYDVEWDCFPAAAFGAPHKRDRLFLTAHNNSLRLRRKELDQDVHARKEGLPRFYPHESGLSPIGDFEWGEYAPIMHQWGRVQGRSVPEPLVRRVDVRASARLEQQRVSSVCDGVLVQAAQFCALRIIEMERNYG